MGLRERNAQQTRATILDVALDCFTEQGYEATTMEEVARRADVSPSTLYRYFPTKEQLVSEPLALQGQMAAELTARPADEPLPVALGHALTALISTPRLDTGRLNRLLAVLEEAPGPQARVRQDFEREQQQLEDAIARRTGRSADDVFCRFTARQATTLLELLTRPRPGGGRLGLEHASEANADAVREALDHLAVMLEELRRDPPVLPDLRTVISAGGPRE